jgi:hypothetical protein
MAWTTPGTAVAGDVLTAAFWNEQVRDNSNVLAPLAAAWTSWTPSSVVQGVSVSGNFSCHYLAVGKLAIVRFDMVVTSSGTANNLIVINLPAALTKRSAGNAYGVTGIGTIYTGSRFPFFLQWNASTTQLRTKPTNTTADDNLGTQGMTQLLNGHQIDFMAMWELA